MISQAAREKYVACHRALPTLDMAPDGSYMGEPSGILLTLDGKILYHAGDTGLFYDMKLIGEMNDIELRLRQELVG